MSVAQHRPTSTTTRKPRKPDPARVYQVFLHEATTSGRRNAASRTAAATGLSDDTVRRIVAKFEQVDDTPPEVQYQPAPGQVEYEVQREQQARDLVSKQPQTDVIAATSVKPEPQAVPHDDEFMTRLFMSSNEPADSACEREVRQIGIEGADQQPQTAAPQRRTIELGEMPQAGPGEPHINVTPRPPISLRDDYLRQRSAPRQTGWTMAQMEWGTVIAWVGPVLLLAGIGYIIAAIVLSAS